MSHPYLLANEATSAGDRFAGLSSLFDAGTFERLRATGIGEGARCWEVGAGGPSVASWMAQQVGSTGRVVATDIDTTWLGGVAEGVEVVVHDVAADPPLGGPFDVVHARLVLVHVPERDEALRRMVGSLAPGGWLVLEDFDTALLPMACLENSAVAQQRANRIRGGFVDLLAQRGVDLRFGRSLVRRLRALGLVDVVADARFLLAGPGSALVERANTTQVAEQLVAGGYATEREIAEHLAALSAGELDIAVPPLVAASGRRTPGAA